MRYMGWDKGRERSPSSDHHGQADLTWENLLQIKSEKDNQKSNQAFKHFPFTPPRRMGNGGWGLFITRCLCCSFSSRAGLLTVPPCSSVGSLAQERVLCGLLHHESSPWTAFCTSPAPPALTLGSAGLLLSHILTPLSWLLCNNFLPLILLEALPQSLTGPALASKFFLELADIGSARHGGISGSFSQKPPL